MEAVAGRILFDIVLEPHTQQPGRAGRPQMVYRENEGQQDAPLSTDSRRMMALQAWSPCCLL